MNDKSALRLLIKKLISIYQQELNLYKEVLQATFKQQEAIKNGDWERLNDLLTERNKIIKDIDNWEKEVKGCRGNISGILGINAKQDFLLELVKYDIPLRDEVKSIVTELTQTIKKIFRKNKTNQENINNKKAKLTKEQSKIKKGLTFNRAYSCKMDSYEGKFIDRKE